MCVGWGKVNDYNKERINHKQKKDQTIKIFSEQRIWLIQYSAPKIHIEQCLEASAVIGLEKKERKNRQKYHLLQTVHVRKGVKKEQNK